ncbi:TPA: hypothetical protein ACK3O9_007068, partial [Burkholderia cepacia]
TVGSIGVSAPRSTCSSTRTELSRSTIPRPMINPARQHALARHPPSPSSSFPDKKTRIKTHLRPDDAANIFTENFEYVS